MKSQILKGTFVSNIVLHAVLIAGAIGAASVSFADSQITSATPLSVALAGEGKLVFLKPLTILGSDTDGSKTYVREIVYQNAGAATHPDKFSCVATFSTTFEDNSSIDYAPGKDAVFAAGDSCPYLTDDTQEERFKSVANADGTVVQWLTLNFNSLATQFMSIGCDATTAANTVLTVGDFEAATNGVMSIR